MSIQRGEYNEVSYRVPNLMLATTVLPNVQDPFDIVQAFELQCSLNSVVVQAQSLSSVNASPREAVVRIL